jgi:hypothetical protein
MLYMQMICFILPTVPSYQDFQKQLKKRSDVKTGSVGVYFGNRITVDQEKLSAKLKQRDYIDDP